MTLRALKARIQRLLPVFTHHGLTLIVDHQWGLATYRTRCTKTPGRHRPVNVSARTMPHRTAAVT